MTTISSPLHDLFTKSCFISRVTTLAARQSNKTKSTKMKTTIITAIVATAFVTTFSAALAGEKEDKITMDKVPAAVREAVKAYAAESEIKGIEDSDVDGTKVIEFDIEKNGKASEIAFRPDGRLFSTEEEVALSDVPEAVQKTISKKSEGAKAGAPEKVVQEGKTSYEVVIEKNGKKIEYTISPKGKVTDKEEVGEKKD
jgi:hypothetical protein